MRKLNQTLIGLTLLALSIFGLFLGQAALAADGVRRLPLTSVQASTETDPSHPALNLVDADPGSVWRSVNGAQSLWTVLEFGGAYRVDYARLYVPGELEGDVSLEYQENGVWRAFAGGAHPALPAAGGWQEVDLSFAGAVAERLRLTVKRAGAEPFLGGFGQIEVYGSEPSTRPARLVPVEVTATPDTNPGFPAGNLVDGNTYSRWQTKASFPQSAWVTLRFAAPARISALKFYGSGEAADALTWEYWDGGGWTPFPELANVPAGSPGRAWQRFEVAPGSVTTDRIRLTVLNQRNHDKLGGFGEVEVWGEPVVDPPALPAGLFSPVNAWSSSGPQVVDATAGTAVLNFILPENLTDFGQALLVFEAYDFDTAEELVADVNGQPVQTAGATRSASDAWKAQAIPLALTRLSPGLNDVTLGLASGFDGFRIDHARIELMARDGSVFPVPGQNPAFDRQVRSTWQAVAGLDGVVALEVPLPGTYQVEELDLYLTDRPAQSLDVEYWDGTTWAQVPGRAGISGQGLALDWNHLALTDRPTTDRLRLRFSGTPGATLGGIGELLVKGSPVNFGPPSVRIANPRAGQLVSNLVTVTGTVDNPETSLTVNGVAATVADGGFSAVIRLDSSGSKDSRTITALAIDTAGRSGRDELQVYLNKRPPGFLSLNPKDGTLVAAQSIIVSGELDDNAPEVTVNGRPARLSGRKFSRAVDLAEGLNRIAVTAVDYFASTAGTTVQLEVRRDTTPPRLTLDSPADGQAVRSQLPAVAGRVEDLSPVTVAVNGRAASVAGGVFQISGVVLAEGENYLDLLAVDAVGNSAALNTKVILDTIPPGMTVTAPAPGQLFNYQPVKVAGVVSDATPAAVVVNGLTALQSGGAFEVWVPLQEGPNTLVAKAVDAAGNESTDIRQVTLDTIPPAVPTGLAVVPGPDNLTVSWPAGSEPDLTYYVLRRTPAFSDGTTDRVIPKADAPSFRDADVTVGDEYTYAVRAVDHAENGSAYSASATGKAGVTATPIDTTQGGEVKYEDLKVQIPAGAIPEGGMVTVVALDSASAPPVTDNRLVGNVLNLDVVQDPGQIASPEETEFSQPVTLTFTYREEDIPAGMTEANLFVYRYDVGTQSWIRVPGQVVDPQTHTITVTVEHFSSYSVQASGAVPPDPATLAGLGVAPYQAYFQENDESVSPSSGDLVIRAVDLRLPGRNGLDLEIARTYDMLSTQIATLDPKSASPLTSFGSGWTLDLPWVGKNDNGQILTLPGGGTYDVKWKMDGSGWDGQGHGTFVYHEGEHFTLEQTQRYVRDTRFLGFLWKTGEVWETTGYTLTMKDGRRYQFDASGKPVNLTDRTGQNTITYTWNGNQLSSITDSLGRTVTFTYSGGRIASLKTGDRTVSYTYGDYLASVTDPQGRKTSYAYTQMGAGKVWDSSGQSSVEKNYTGLLGQVTYPGGGYTKYSYRGKDDGFGSGITRAVVGGKTQYAATGSFNDTAFTYSWNSDQKITAATISAPAQITALTFNDKSLTTRKVTKDRTKGSILVEQVDYEYNLSLKAVTKESYTRADNDPASGQYRFGPAYYQTYAYDNWGNVTYQYHSGTGLESRYAYANTSSAQSFPAPFATAPFTSTGPAKVHNLLTGQGQLNHDPVRGVTIPVQTHYRYDAAGNLVEEAKRHDGGWLRTIFEYDQYANGHQGAYGNVTGKTDPLGRVTRYDYSSAYGYAYPTKVTVEGVQDADGAALPDVVTETGYEFATGWKTSEKDARGYVTSYTYDKLGRLKTTTYPDNAVKRADFDDVNNTYTSTDENGNKTTFFYDGLNHLVKVIQYKKDGVTPYATTTFAYDASGNVASMTDAENHTASYLYDGLGRLTKTTYVDGSVAQQLYDNYDNAVTGIDSNGHKTYQKKDWGDRLLQVVQYNTATGEILTTQIAYDRLGNKVQVTDPRGDTTRQVFDDLGRPTDVFYPAMALVKPGAADETTDTPHVSYTYDAVGNKFTETSAAGNAATDPTRYTTTYAYDALNRPIRMVEPFTAQDGALKQRVTKTYYDPVGNKVKVVDGNGHATTFEYDARKRLTKQTDARGYWTTHAYDPVGNRIKTTEPRGYATWYVYDELNRLVRGVLPDETPPVSPYLNPEDNPYVEFTYDKVGNKLSERDPNGNVTSFAYTPRYWLETVTDPTGAVTTFGYDKVGNQTSVTDPNRNTTTNAYDDLNRLTKTTNPDGQARSFGYDRVGNRTSQTDTNGHATEWAYNPLRKLIQVKDAKAGITRYRYDPNGNLVAMIDAKGQTTRYAYNELGWLLKETNSLGLVSTYDYDLAGNRVSAKSPRGVKTTYQYYPNNLLQQVTYALGSDQESIAYEYDPAGNRTRMTDPSGQAVYSFDPLNQVTAAQKSVLGRSYATEYRYDKAGNVTGVLYPGASAWLEYQYNSTDRLSAIPGLADGTTANPAFAYDPAGNLRSVRLNSGVTSALTPDKLNRLANVQVSSPKLAKPVLALVYTYDGEGNILTRNENTYRYDELDRLVYSQVKGIFADDLPARRGYVTGDFVGDKALDYSTGDQTPVSFDYASSSAGLDFGTSAQVRGLFLTKEDPSADTSRIKPNTLDLYGSPDGSTFTRLDPATYTLQTTQDGLTFEFADPRTLAELKVHSKFDDRNEDGTFADQAAFKNTLGELLKAEQEVFQATLEYGYDAVGNRTYERFTKAATHSKDYTYYANSNRLLSDGHYAFVYDDDGNLIRKGNKFTLSGETVSFTTDGKGVEYWEYSYNLRNQLSQVQRNGQLVATYAYDGLGLRVSALTTITSKTTGQSKTTTRDYLFDLADRVIYDKVISTAGSLPAAEDPETSTENSYVFANGTHFAKLEGPIGSTAEIYYYHNDHLGSPMAITDKDGNLAWSQDYLPYGEALNESATQTKTRFTFTGKELDPATGLMYYNARWYDPDLGRFMTEDTYAGNQNEPQTLNRFAYVSGNPLKYVDPDGRKIRLATTDRYLVATYREAIEYLRGSDDFEKVYDMLEKSSNTITIEIDRFLADGDAYSPRNDTVKWDPDSGLRVGSGDVQTPAMGLAHEMVHAAQDQAGLIPSNPTVEQRLVIENAVVTQYETPIAMDLGEPVRNDYDDVDWSDPTPTTTDPISNDEDNWPGRW